MKEEKVGAGPKAEPSDLHMEDMDDIDGFNNFEKFFGQGSQSDSGDPDKLENLKKQQESIRDFQRMMKQLQIGEQQ